jgi:RNA recognition motif-containing protein
MDEHGHSKIFVGNLPFKTRNEDLESLFSRFGPVIGVSIRKDRKTNKPKGFAFVSFGIPEAGPEAIRVMNGYSLEGRPLTVNEADKRGGGGGGEGEDEEAIAAANAWKTVPDPPPSAAASAGAGGTSNKASKGSKSWTSWAGPPK